MSQGFTRGSGTVCCSCKHLCRHRDCREGGEIHLLVIVVVIHIHSAPHITVNDFDIYSGDLKFVFGICGGGDISLC